MANYNLSGWRLVIPLGVFVLSLIACGSAISAILGKYQACTAISAGGPCPSIFGNMLVLALASLIAAISMAIASVVFIPRLRK